jgi:zinc D-Ala-D-Ala carboxypeptidase
MKISRFVWLSEVIKSNTATRKGIDNSPTSEQLERITKLSEMVFDPLREWVGDQVKINSGFRSPKLNKAIGGAGGINGTSQHCANNGAAFDIDDTFGHATNAQMFHYIKDNMSFDQMIWEFGDDNNPDWVHVSYVSEAKNRMEILVAKKNSRNKTYYSKYEI